MKLVSNGTGGHNLAISTTAFRFNPTIIIIADFNSDGTQDVILVTLNTNTFYAPGRGDVAFAPSVLIGATGVRANDAYALDIDKDGYTDLVGLGASWSDIAYVGLATGPATFLRRPSQNIDDQKHILVELDGDGVLNIVQPSGLGNGIYVGLGVGDGFFTMISQRATLRLWPLPRVISTAMATWMYLGPIPPRAASRSTPAPETEILWSPPFPMRPRARAMGGGFKPPISTMTACRIL